MGLSPIRNAARSEAENAGMIRNNIPEPPDAVGPKRGKRKTREKIIGNRYPIEEPLVTTRRQ